MTKPSTNVVAAVSDTDLLSISAVVIVESNCKYKGLNVRLISDWVDCCANSKVYFHQQRSHIIAMSEATILSFSKDVYAVCSST